MSADQTTAPVRRQRRSAVTRRRLLDAAEIVFGEVGFHAAAISQITQTAGVAQGTFYVHFTSKEELFTQLVADISRSLRHEMTRAAAVEGDRLAAERAGLVTFFDYTQRHPGLYRIVQEAQFVDPPSYRRYYQRLADGYARALSKAAEAGEIAPGDSAARAWALMGVGHFLGLYHCQWQGAVPSAATLDAAMDFIAHGLRGVAAPVKKAAAKKAPAKVVAKTVKARK